jgi:hypothetical protein
MPSAWPQYLLQFLEQAPGTGNVTLLRRLVATAQQNNQDLSALDEIHAIAWTSKDSQLMKSATKALTVTQISKSD